MIRHRSLELVLLFPLLVAAQAPQSRALLSAEQIVERMRAADAARSEQLQGYTAFRRYVLYNHRFHKQGTIVARLTYRSPGEKSLEVMCEDGSRLIRDRVLKRVIRAEEEASEAANRGLARIDLVNYDIQVLGTETDAGLTLYILGLEPRSRSPYLVRGRAWVDASEYALVRLEGVVAKKPSIWVGSPVIQQTYVKSGPFWLPDKNLSTTDAPLFGRTDLTIESSGYEIRRAPEREAVVVRSGN
ncbi:MAG TPA: hypothetical protein VMH80_11015 [Bryobacteraceae bacterium]|nr:hypothetical protein [Bryobacteraceae bacterium]